MTDDKLWRAFSVYIRLRDSDENGYCKCATSGQIIHWKECDAGHFISRRHLATKYHEKNVHAQRRFDNRFASGKQYEYGRFIDKKYGEGTADLLLALSKTRGKAFSKFEVDELTKHYKKEAERIAKSKGLTI